MDMMNTDKNYIPVFVNPDCAYYFDYEHNRFIYGKTKEEIFDLLRMQYGDLDINEITHTTDMYDLNKYTYNH